MSQIPHNRHPRDITDRIVLLHCEGLAASAIGDDVGMTRNAIIGIIHRQRVKAGADWSGPMKKVSKPKRADTRVKRPAPPVIEKLLAAAPKSRGRITGLNVNVDRFDTAPEPIDIPSRSEWKQPDYSPTAALTGRAASILDVKECRAPVNIRAGIQLFCNTQRQEHSSYCPQHHRLFNYEPRARTR